MGSEMWIRDRLEAVILLAQGVLVLLVWSSRKDAPWPSQPWHSEGVTPERQAAGRGGLARAGAWLIPGLLLAVLSALARGALARL